jgi:hypothetical protein
MKGSNIWAILTFIFGCTVCVVLIANQFGALILKIPTNADNIELRLRLADILNTICGFVMGIVAAKLSDKKVP